MTDKRKKCTEQPSGEIGERKRTEETLLECEALYRALFDGSPDAILLADPDTGLIVDANPAASRLLARPHEEIVGLHQSKIHPPQKEAYSREIFTRHIEDTRRRGKSHPAEAAVIRPDGSEVPVEILAQLVTFKNKKILQGVFRDITERKRVEETLRESRNLLQTVLDTIPARVFWKDRDLRYLGCNQPFALDAGVNSPEEMIGKDDYQMGWREQADLYRSDDRQVMESGKPKIHYEEPQTTPDGRRIWLRTNKVPLRHADGTTWGAMGTYEDITEYKQAEESLRRNEERFRSIAETLPDIIYRLSPDGSVIYASPSVQSVLGFTVEETVGKSFTHFIHPDDMENAVDAYRQLLEGKQVRNLQLRVLKKSGSAIDAEINVIPLAHDGPVSEIQGVIRDITERKQADAEKEKLQAQFIQAQKMESVGRLAGGVAHDFNNMLSVILGYADMALRQLDQHSPLRSNLQNIQLAAKRSADLTRQLLAFARKQIIAPKVLDLNETVEGMLQMLHRLIGENIDVVLVPCTDLWKVKVDPSQVDQILVNLLVNARDAIADKGAITIETRNVVLDEAYCAGHRGFVPGRFVMLTVSDDGCGMDREILAHIFEPFFTTKGIGQGTGLGLATVYGIVKQNDGFVNVYSEPGQGTAIKIYLPRFETRPVPAPAESPALDAKGGKEMMLLVEDDPMILALCKTLLEDMGYTALTARTPDEAIDRAGESAGRINLLITDVVMPGMNGWELAKRLRTLYPDIKTLFMSGYTANVIAHGGVLEEGVHFMQKPFSRNELAAKVREALEGDR
jgi:two-component system cell cycle sensor histidine kinase/response regulator CckA